MTGSHSSDDKAKQSLAQARRALAARASGWRTGRGKEEWPPVPSVRQYQIEAVAVWANMHRENRRPLTVAAPLLAIVCALYDKGHPLPVARRLADAIGCSKDGIDAAISMALAYDEVSERYEVIDGGVSARVGSRRLRFIEPSQELYDVYKNAARRGGSELSSSNG